MTTAATVPGCPVDESFDPLSPEFLADPYSVLAERPENEAPVFFAPSIGYYVVTSYAAIEAVFRDPATYSAAVAQAPLAPIVPEAQQILLAGGHKPQPTHGQPGRARTRQAPQAGRPGVQHEAGHRHDPHHRGHHGPAARRRGRRDRNSTWSPRWRSRSRPTSSSP